MLSWFSPLLEAGSPAPEFSLPDEQGRGVALAELLRRGPVVLVFYPMDETPVCRGQLCEIRDVWGEFESGGVAVLGINPGSAASHAKFRGKHGFPFPLLVDRGQKVARLYHANGLVLRRSVYAVGRDGRILFAERGKPHPSRILAAITAPASPP